MDSKTIWNRIVEQHQKNFNAQETVVQKEWESIFTAFGYNSFFGEIDSHRTIHIGSGKNTIPDIIIRTDNVDLFDVELKQYNLSFDIEMEKQLLSYMKLLEISVGILVCKNLYIYVYDKKETKRLKIDFTQDNPDGIEFVDLFYKGNFSIQKIEKFIDSKNDFDKNVAEITKEITNNFVVDLIKNYLESMYLPEEIAAALTNISISVTNIKISPQEIKDDDTDDIEKNPSEGMDYSKYRFEGNSYGKGKLVLAVVTAYVRDNPNITYSELRDIFYDKLQGSTGVVRLPIEGAKNRKDPEKRFFTKHPIFLKNGEIWVCSQWGIKNINNFIKTALALGYKIDRE